LINVATVNDEARRSAGRELQTTVQETAKSVSQVGLPFLFLQASGYRQISGSICWSRTIPTASDIYSIA